MYYVSLDVFPSILFKSRNLIQIKLNAIFHVVSRTLNGLSNGTLVFGLSLKLGMHRKIDKLK
jgi:hypothetical protein